MQHILWSNPFPERHVNTLWFCFLGNACKRSSLSFLFSLRNNENLVPFIANLKPGYEQWAVSCHPTYGPAFGGGHDLYISDNANDNNKSYSARNFSSSYQLPLGAVEPASLLAGGRNFSPTEIEVFI